MSDSLTIQQLTTEEFCRFQNLVNERSGIAIGNEKIAMLSNRLRKRLRALKLSSFAEYYAYLRECADDAEEVGFFLSAVSTNETYFYRNSRLWSFVGGPLINHLVDINAKQKVRQAAFWSAAGSSGEEAYTLAMVLREKLPEFSTWHIDIVATDISRNVLSKAQAGVYNDYALHKIDPAQRKQYFRTLNNDSTYELRQDIRNMVRFEFHNLRELFKKNYFDVVFLRNVMMYFDLDMKKRVLKNVVSALKAHGWLISGDVDPLQAHRELIDFGGLKQIFPNTYCRKTVASK